MMSAKLEPAFNQFTKMLSMPSGYWLPSAYLESAQQ